MPRYPPTYHNTHPPIDPPNHSPNQPFTHWASGDGSLPPPRSIAQAAAECGDLDQARDDLDRVGKDDATSKLRNKYDL